MPANLTTLIGFLETQWSSINANKVIGIHAELAFKTFLAQNNVHCVPGGWIMSPGKNTLINIPTREKIALLPRAVPFSWQGITGNAPNQVSPAEISAYNYFRQVRVDAFFVSPVAINRRAELGFSNPTPSTTMSRAQYPRNYELEFLSVSPNGQFISTPIDQIFRNFPLRMGNTGLRCAASGRLQTNLAPWNNPSEMVSLFWFEYARYFVQVQYLVSNNDLDLFLVGRSGSSYPVELKSKQAASDRALGEWFGIDMGPYAKLSFFTANSMNTDALYVVQEVDEQRTHVQWHGIRFTELVKCCSWVGQGGGTGMMGGASSTYKIPKAAFVPLLQLLPTL